MAVHDTLPMCQTPLLVGSVTAPELLMTAGRGLLDWRSSRFLVSPLSSSTVLTRIVYPVRESRVVEYRRYHT